MPNEFFKSAHENAVLTRIEKTLAAWMTARELYQSQVAGLNRSSPRFNAMTAKEVEEAYVVHHLYQATRAMRINDLPWMLRELLAARQSLGECIVHEPVGRPSALNGSDDLMHNLETFLQDRLAYAFQRIPVNARKVIDELNNDATAVSR